MCVCVFVCVCVCMTLLSHSFNSSKQLLSTNYVSDSFLDTGCRALNKADLSNSDV